MKHLAKRIFRHTKPRNIFGGPLSPLEDQFKQHSSPGFIQPGVSQTENIFMGDAQKSKTSMSYIQSKISMSHLQSKSSIEGTTVYAKIYYL